MSIKSNLDTIAAFTSAGLIKRKLKGQALRNFLPAVFGWAHALWLSPNPRYNKRV